ncbi:MAG: RsmB/NOP family class I SAM-dependent RNA methyltransferase [Hyphomicrobiales bacterium]|nr:RsmB/NOP family class I SAM-dependent RNA methyltransferase [Hyphomicrobiales bacterium]MDE2114740.1 RsmB/NOP family class I SAM-dependent RNA methyltransferase [Hyphomicrobiales bacterium]
MIPAARIAAAIEILEDLEERRRPAADAVKDWGLRHRFAGSKDRAAISSLLFDALRARASSAYVMGAQSGRAIILGMLHMQRAMSVEAIAELCSGQGHAPASLTDAERDALEKASLDEAPAYVAGDYPEWLEPQFERAYGDMRISEGRALAARAPVDLRVNRLKAKPDRQLTDLAHLGAIATPFSPMGLRLPVGADGRGPALAAEPGLTKGLIEVQDEGSQIAALLTCAKEGEQALDFCAGAGGKTLALAAMMGNKGQIYACDSDGRRLMPIYDRLERAGARNVQVRAPKAGVLGLTDLAGRCDLVLVDAPCSGSGTWRRNPDAKWRMRPGALALRIQEQDEVLQNAQEFVKPGGRLVYVTCSVLVEENEDRIAAFLASHDDFQALDPATMLESAGLASLQPFVSKHGPGLRLSPFTTQTDGFFITTLQRKAA